MSDEGPSLVLDASATIPLLLKTVSPSVPKLTEALIRAPLVFVPTLHAFEGSPKLLALESFQSRNRP